MPNYSPPTQIGSLLDELVHLRTLASVAFALIGDNRRLTPAERKIVTNNATPVSDELIEATHAAIRRCTDPLGSAYCLAKSSGERRSWGQTFTPEEAIVGMFQWVEARGTVDRIVDPGAGTGRYVLTGLRRNPNAVGVAVEADPFLALLMRANAHALGYADRLQILIKDYRVVRLSAHAGRTAFVGNPPYVRHHDIAAEWKVWYSGNLKKLGHASSQLAGLHLHFFLRTLELAKPGDVGCFITSAEWLDVKYGQSLRDLLLGGLGGRSVSVVSPEIAVFEDALVSACITGFEPKVASPGITFKILNESAQMLNLDGGHFVSRERAEASNSWGQLLRNRTPVKNVNSVLLGDLFRVSRGQVTGRNEIFVPADNRFNLPEEFLVPAITDAKDIINATRGSIDDTSTLRKVVQLPARLGEVPAQHRCAVAAYLRWARKNGAHKSFIARSRRPWWRVNMSAVPPIVMTYMGRRPPVFAVNRAGAALLNIAHGLYPKVVMDEKTLENLVEWLNCNITVESGRVYAGGLTKFEPSEVMRLEIPHPASLRREPEA